MDRTDSLWTGQDNPFVHKVGNSVDRKVYPGDSTENSVINSRAG